MAYDVKKMATYGVAGILVASIIITSMQVHLSSATGTLTILVTDPPEWGDATQVYVNITGIAIHSNVSGWTTLTVPGGREYLEVNLTEALDAEVYLLEADLVAGKYNILRFNISSAIVTVDSSNMTDVKVPSGKINIVITEGGVTIKSNEDSELLLDIETRVVYSKGRDQYQLVPAAKATP
ncbi:MAG: DUF4382 domain-containing protein, partial [Candidatus Bathyarchaeia archaeon]